MKKFCLKPIGVVRSTFKGNTGMPFRGVEAKIKIDPVFKKALEGLRACQHIWVFCFLHDADRSVLKTVPKKWKRRGILKERGVFSMRAPCRPNPVSLSLVRIVKRRGLTLTVDKLDAYTGTPVVDIKPYSKNYDSPKKR